MGLYNFALRLLPENLHHVLHLFSASIRGLAIERRGKGLNVHPRQISGVEHGLGELAMKHGLPEAAAGNVDYDHESPAPLRILHDRRLMGFWHIPLCN